MPGPEGEQPPMPPEGLPSPPEGGESPKQAGSEPTILPEPSSDDVKKFDLELQDYESESDIEDIDYSVGE
jgi:hypothetical protein